MSIHSNSQMQGPVDARGNGQGRLLRVKTGYNPNSSSVGTDIAGIPAALPAVMLAVPVLFGTVAALVVTRFLRAGGGHDDGAAPADTKRPSSGAAAAARQAVASDGQDGVA